MQEQQQIQLQADPNGYYLTGVSINRSEEEFYIFLQSQNSVRQYICSPKHAKRISLLFSKVVAEYEKQFGEIKTELPSVPSQTSEKTVGFEAKK